MIGSQLTDCLTPWSKVHLEKLIVPWLTNKLSTFHQNQRFATFARASHMSCPEADQSNPFLPFCFLKISFNVINPSMPGSSKWSFRLGFCSKTMRYSFPCSYIPNISHRLFDSSDNILWIVEIMNLLIIYSLLHSCVTLPFCAQIASSAPQSQTPSAYVPPSLLEIMFHTHIKQHARLEFCVF